MRAGELRHRITIQKPDDAASSWGGDRSWHTYATVWASIRPISGSERISLRQDIGEITHIIRCRYIQGVTPAMRISFQGKTYSIESPPMDIGSRHIELEMEAKEIVAG